MHVCDLPFFGCIRLCFFFFCYLSLVKTGWIAEFLTIVGCSLHIACSFCFERSHRGPIVITLFVCLSWFHIQLVFSWCMGIFPSSRCACLVQLEVLQNTRMVTFFSCFTELYLSRFHIQSAYLWSFWDTFSKNGSLYFCSLNVFREQEFWLCLLALTSSNPCLYFVFIEVYEIFS